MKLSQESNYNECSVSFTAQICHVMIRTVATSVVRRTGGRRVHTAAIQVDISAA